MMTNDRREQRRREEELVKIFNVLLHYYYFNACFVECSILKGTLIEHDRNGERRKSQKKLNNIRRKRQKKTVCVISSL